jgi:hypothetical protein
MREHLSFLGTTVLFGVEPGAEPAFARVRRFFRHHLGPQPEPALEPTYAVAVRAYRPDDEIDPALWDGEQSVIRRSSAPEFTFHAHVVDHGERRLYVNRETLLDAPRDATTDPRFELAITDGSAVQVIDFVRDLVIRHEEARGTIALHAAGICDGEAGVVIAGPKGAGKTTTLLAALQRPGWRYFTGDKVFCQLVDGEVEVYPWRDYPYVGVGTIMADPRLTDLVRDAFDPDVDRRPASDKLLLDPDVFEAWLGSEFSPEPRRLGAVLLPEMRPGEILRGSVVDDPNERWARINKIVDRQLDTTFFTWQSHLVPDYAPFYATLSRMREVLDGVPMIRLRGVPGEDPDGALDLALERAR